MSMQRCCIQPFDFLAVTFVRTRNQTKMRMRNIYVSTTNAIRNKRICISWTTEYKYLILGKQTYIIVLIRIYSHYTVPFILSNTISNLTFSKMSSYSIKWWKPRDSTHAMSPLSLTSTTLARTPLQTSLVLTLRTHVNATEHTCIHRTASTLAQSTLSRQEVFHDGGRRASQFLK